MTYLVTNVLIAFIALLFERLIGYPNWLYTLIRHPVVWFGWIISLLDKLLNKSSYSNESRKLNGALALLFLLVITFIAAIILTSFTRSLTGGPLIEAIAASSLLAQKSLHTFVKAVADALDVSLEAGREAIRHIVGRDPDALNESEIAKAAIESLAENTSDGVIAPLFWMALFGLPGALIYKVINTADSMIGYKSEKYLSFGCAAARLDDVVNYPASRLTALLFAASATFSRKGNGKEAINAMFRDAPHHISPNAGWPEASMAGGLGITLGGVRAYENKIVDLATMGHGRHNLTRDDIFIALKFYRRSLTLTALLLLAILLIGLGIAI
ncbi:MAG: adenosylcobinamide-phosphate synthase CbiB [Hyphomicrobiales bacterium]